MMLGIAVMFSPTFIQWYKGPNDNPSPSRLLQFTGTAATLVAIGIFNMSRGFTNSDLSWSGQNSTAWQHATLAMVALTILVLRRDGYNGSRPTNDETNRVAQTFVNLRMRLIRFFSCTPFEVRTKVSPVLTDPLK